MYVSRTGCGETVWMRSLARPLAARWCDKCQNSMCWHKYLASKYMLVSTIMHQIESVNARWRSRDIWLLSILSKQDAVIISLVCNVKSISESLAVNDIIDWVSKESGYIIILTSPKVGTYWPIVWNEAIRVVSLAKGVIFILNFLFHFESSMSMQNEIKM